jgi:integrase
MAVKKVTHGRGTSYEVTAKVDGRTVRRRFARKDAALDFQAQVRQEARSGSFVHPADRKTTFAAYSTSWAEHLQVRDSTLANYRANLRNHLLPTFGPRRLDRITRADVQSFITDLRAGHLAPATIRAVVNLLRTILRSAVHDGKITKSPCYKITLPEVPPKRLAFFTPEQVRELLAAAKPCHYAVLTVAVGTGLRQGELLGLTVDVVDLDRGRLQVRQQMASPVGAGQPALTAALKTRASQRTVGLPAFVVTALREHLATYGTGEDGLLFANPRGQGWRRGSFNDSVWKPALRRAGLDERFGIHACRHTYASGLIAQGKNVKEVQAALGHATATETYDTYLHLWPGAVEEAAAAIDALFGPARPALRSVG